MVKQPWCDVFQQSSICKTKFNLFDFHRMSAGVIWQGMYKSSNHMHVFWFKFSQKMAYRSFSYFPWAVKIQYNRETMNLNAIKQCYCKLYKKQGLTHQILLKGVYKGGTHKPVFSALGRKV